MLKYAIVLCIGLAAGYEFGFKDGKDHDEGIVTRTIDHLGGSARGKYNNDVDAQMDKLEKH
jgi:hypothetical protein